VSLPRPLIGISTHKSQAQRPAQGHVYGLHSLYSEGVVAGGGAPVQIPHGLDRGTLRAIFERMDGLLLSGGGDVDPVYYGETASDKVYGVDRERDEMELALVRWAVASGKPLLAICRGIQVMNVALGGSLYQDILADMPGAMRHAYFQEQGFPRDHPAHGVHLNPGSHLANLLDGDEYTVNSLHHQGIKEPAPDLVPVGHAPDGLVEAVEVHGHPFAIGVQWHPEALAPKDPAMRRLFEALVSAARQESASWAAAVSPLPAR
jgi:putative glutamine amidotransferase